MINKWYMGLEIIGSPERLEERIVLKLLRDILFDDDEDGGIISRCDGPGLAVFSREAATFPRK